MSLGTEVDLGPGHIVLDVDPVIPARKGHSSPSLFGPCVLWRRRAFQLLLSSCY